MPTETAATWPCRGIAAQLTRAAQMADGIRQRHVTAGDGRGAGAAIGLQHITVNHHPSLAQGFQVDHGPQGSADETLDLDSAPLLTAPGRLPVGAAAGGPGQHPVFRCDPAAVGVAQPGWHPVFDGRGA